MPARVSLRTSSTLLAGLTLLAGCNDSGDGAPPATTISGTAAVGAPLSAATIDLRCKGGATATLMTEADGDWSYMVPGSQLPCAVRASGGVAGSAANTQTFYSLTLGNGGNVVANATPLTTLVLADVANTTPGDAWFASLDATALQALATGVPASTLGLVEWLRGLGYAVPAGDFDPFTQVFEPVSGDPYDDLLEQFGAVLAANGLNVEMASAVVASGTITATATSTHSSSASFQISNVNLGSSGSITNSGMITIGGH